jgi:Arc/MetJ-type ribon-helix-helix transcriptional regulator
MGTLNVKIPDEMDEDLDAYLADHPHYLNKSELVRDALRHLVGERELSSPVERKVKIGRRQIAEDEDLVPLDEA